jgi:hypothetical protein
MKRLHRGTTFNVQYRGPVVDAGRMTYEETEKAAGGAVRAAVRGCEVLFGSAVVCEASAVFIPREGRIAVSVTCTEDGRRALAKERALVEALTGAIQLAVASVVSERDGRARRHRVVRTVSVGIILGASALAVLAGYAYLHGMEYMPQRLAPVALFYLVVGVALYPEKRESAKETT